MSMRPNGPPIGRALAQVIAALVAAMWAISLLARMANPDRYPVPAEVHYLMGAVVAAAFGLSSWVPTRQRPADPPPPPPPPQVQEGERDG